MKIAIIDTKELIYENVVKKAVLPGADGEFCVLDHHQPFIYRLGRGKIRIDDSFSLNIENGIARMKANELVIMVDR